MRSGGRGAFGDTEEENQGRVFASFQDEGFIVVLSCGVCESRCSGPATRYVWVRAARLRSHGELPVA